MRLRELNCINDCEIKRIANLHMKAFPQFFLTQLGRSFLVVLYSGYIEDNNSGIIVAEKDGELLGFLAYSKDYPGFFKCLIRHYIIRFAICSLGAAIRHPK